MKNVCVIFSFLVLLFSCSEKKNSVTTDSKNENTILIEVDTILNLPNSITYGTKGYIISPKIAVYNNSLYKKDSLSITEDVAQVDILEITKEMITASGDTLNNPCPTANFIKIKYSNKEYIVYGTDIYESIKEESFNFKNDINGISLFAIKNFSIGSSGFGELTGCDDYHPLIIFEKNKFHKIHSIPEVDYYSKNNNLDYYYLNYDDGIREKIETVSLNKDTVLAKIRVDYQDGYSYYDLNIIKDNNGIFKSTVSNKTEVEFE